MTSSTDRIMMRLNGLQIPHPVILGTFVSASGSTCVINIGDVSVTVPSVGLSSPTAGMPVRLQRNAAGQLVILGTAAPQTIGTVAPVETLPPKPVVAPTKLTQSTVIRATDSGKFYFPSSVWDQQNPAATVTSSGAWFYGSRVRNYLKGWTPDSIQIYLPLVQQMGVCRMGHHIYGSRPSGWTGSSAEFTLNDRSGWVSLPLSFATYLRDNVGGITVTSGNGLNRWKGTATDSLSGALRLTAHR